jgi:hypothetical protein
VVSRIRTALVMVLFLAAAAGLMLAAPFGDINMVIAYVLLVEAPAAIVLVMLLSAYINWESNR